MKPHQQEATEHDAVEDEEQDAYTHHRPMKGERSGVITGVLPGRETVEAAVVAAPIICPKLGRRPARLPLHAHAGAAGDAGQIVAEIHVELGED